MREANLTLIQTFFIVARDGSYSAAARKLGMSYQSAANHVRRLEQVLEERLVLSEQGAKTVTLTPRGRSLYKLLLPELDTVLARLDRTLDKERPVLRIGLPQAIFYYLLPPILARALRSSPAASRRSSPSSTAPRSMPIPKRSRGSPPISRRPPIGRCRRKARRSRPPGPAIPISPAGSRSTPPPTSSRATLP